MEKVWVPKFKFPGRLTSCWATHDECCTSLIALLSHSRFTSISAREDSCWTFTDDADCWMSLRILCNSTDRVSWSNAVTPCGGTLIRERSTGHRNSALLELKWWGEKIKYRNFFDRVILLFTYTVYWGSPFLIFCFWSLYQKIRLGQSLKNKKPHLVFSDVKYILLVRISKVEMIIPTFITQGIKKSEQTIYFL